MSSQEIDVPIGGLVLAGTLAMPEDAIGLVVFAHGTGSNRHSPRNQYMAAMLASHRIATLLVDLLTPEEVEYDEQAATLHVDADVLGERLIAVLDGVVASGIARGLPIGLCGGSAGAAAALIAAARRPALITAVVSRSGRTDLAEAVLDDVHAPTLLIAGSSDLVGVRHAREAAKRLPASRHAAIVSGAGALFEEPGALDEAGFLAWRWFDEQFRRAPVPLAAAAR